MAGDSILDRNALDALKALDEPGSGKNILDDLIHLFIKTGTDHVNTITAALRAGDDNAAQGQAHSLKSSAANLGAPRLSALCKELETGGTLNAGQRTRFLAEIPAEFQRTCDALRGELSKK
jgi:HPt (histidine-containing phosphotransfer) domain-containing protein